MATKQLQILGSFNQDAVQFVEQDLTDEQKAQARDNIGAAALDDIKGYITATELNSVIESFDTAISDIIGSGVLS